MKKRRQQWKIYFVICLSWLILSVTGCTPVQQTQQPVLESTAVKGELTIHFLDVGEGNATLIESEGKYMLIDGGVNAKSSYVVAYLKKQGIESLNYVIATHYDADHLAGVVGVLHVFPVETIIGPQYSTDTKIYRSFMEQLSAHDYTLISPDVGDEYQMGDITFTVVGPARYGHTDENDDSVAVRIRHGDNSFLIAGDAGAESEQEIAESGVHLKSDVYLVNHHGSETSTTQEFLDLVDPEYAVISSGTEGNNYGHPRKAVLDRLQQKDVKLFRTDIQGEVIVTSDGTGLSFSQEPCNDFTPGGEGTTSENTQATAEDTTAVISEEGATYILNTSSRKFHLPDCQAVENMKDKNKSYFTGTKEEAIENGYDPCGWCLP